MNRRVRTIGFLLAIVAAVTIVWFALISMPGRSFAGAPPRLTAQQFALRAALEHDVRELSARIGERNDAVADHLDAAAAYIEESFRRSGLRPARQIFMVNGTPCANIEAELRGRSNPDQIVVIGAHYDSVDESPGADDNASGTASLLALARRAARSQPARTLRFVAFVNEEPPHFQTSEMGSVVYAKRSFDRHEKIVAMISIESIGYFNETDGSQAYPALLAPFFPSRGDFIAFAGNLGSRRLLRRTIGAFRTPATIPSEGAAMPELIHEIGWSDQWSFWQFGYEAIMVTDTAPFRNPNYHTERDRPDTLDYDRMSRVVDALGPVLDRLTTRD
jgi:Zn-dependent M28 family amino/carboxypeptidase